jgi:hypothetical protein
VIFIRDALVADEFDVTARTIARWDDGKSPAPPGWPRPVYIGRRKFREANALEACRKAIADASTTRETKDR